ncbi:MAG: hypothetical protein IAI50_02915 [Candidatus Eremiobacteraeota bacterium]|nr:hypothetical protein [Candidatus Eremiobacteraeota bacterium]
MNDTEPMPVVEPRPAPTRAFGKLPAVLAFAAGATLALFVACVWMQLQMSELRQDVREARQAAASARAAADRIAQDVRSPDPNSADAGEANATEDSYRARMPAEPVRPVERVALHVRVVAGVRARLQALRTMVRELRALW